MKILLVEDDKNKISQIVDHLKKVCPDNGVEVARSYGSGLKKIMTCKWDLLLLDMSLPGFDITGTDDGLYFDAFAGRQLLKEMKRKKVRIKTVILTQYETFGEGKERMSLAELSAKLAQEFVDSYAGTVYYSPAQSDWKANLEKYISR